MGKLERFLKANKKDRENVFFPATAAITDDEGKPILWEIKPLTTARCEEIKQDCIRVTTGENGVARERLDTARYMEKLLAASVVSPNLLSAELQDSYGVYTPEELLKAIIDNPGEYAAFGDFVYSLMGFKTFKERVAEAKN